MSADIPSRGSPHRVAQWSKGRSDASKTLTTEGSIRHTKAEEKQYAVCHVTLQDSLSRRELRTEAFDFKKHHAVTAGILEMASDL